MATKPTVGRFINRKTIVQMVQNFIDRTYKADKDGKPKKVTHDMDSHAVYYSKSKLDQLFKDNGYDPEAPDADSFGIRIYLGMHQHTELEDAAMPTRPESYMNQHTVILVCTKDGVDQLNNKDAAKDGDDDEDDDDGTGNGLEEGQICPPPTCSDMDGDLKP